MVKYLINDTTTYRVSTIEDVEALHEELKNDPTFELGSFSYKTKQVKAKGEIIDEYVNQYDDQFHKNVNYIDIYYCEKELGIRKLAENKYTIGLSVLESFYRDNLDIIEYLR